jgi:hypothetical protein
MSKVWVLDTETKGTGAHVEPLDRARSSAERPLSVTRFKPPERPAPEPPARTARRFRVVDVLSAQLLVDDVQAPAAIAALRLLRKPIDARVYVREQDEERWRLLTLGETRALWEFGRDAGAMASGAPAAPGSR